MAERALQRRGTLGSRLHVPLHFPSAPQDSRRTIARGVRLIEGTWNVFFDLANFLPGRDCPEARALEGGLLPYTLCNLLI